MKRITVRSEVSGEFIQGDALPDRYFKVAVKGDRAVAVKVFEKKTDRLLQTIDVDTQQRGADGVSVGDYNFDGVQDFSIFESSYAGPNTSSLYYLYDPAKKHFFNSGWEGTSFEFDAEKEIGFFYKFLLCRKFGDKGDLPRREK